MEMMRRDLPTRAVLEVPQLHPRRYDTYDRAMPELDDQRVQGALHAMLGENVQALRDAVEMDPDVVTESWSGNTLLEWLTQPPHQINSGIVAILIDAGSALDRALNLAGCWNLDALCNQLLVAGANPAARADSDLTPLESAAMHGATRSADVLVARGLHRPSLWLAAATGQLDHVRRWVDPNGELVDDPGPYRPDLADVGHAPGPTRNDEPGVIIAEAFVFAGANNRMAVVDYLTATGADVDAGVHLGMTALHLAILFRNPDAVAGLLERGADPTIRDGRHDSDAAGWARACHDDDPASNRVAELLGAW